MFCNSFLGFNDKSKKDAILIFDTIVRDYWGVLVKGSDATVLDFNKSI